mmetsp:Transcript_32134/g.89513  ORF Transcript_32134/g.89513 Transcript_32134/m.89513 type:complete len:284 (-) Transcript_32134:128-979(-)
MPRPDAQHPWARRRGHITRWECAHTPSLGEGPRHVRERDHCDEVAQEPHRDRVGVLPQSREIKHREPLRQRRDRGRRAPVKPIDQKVHRTFEKTMMKQPEGEGVARYGHIHGAVPVEAGARCEDAEVDARDPERQGEGPQDLRDEYRLYPRIREEEGGAESGDEGAHDSGDPRRDVALVPTAEAIDQTDDHRAGRREARRQHPGVGRRRAAAQEVGGGAHGEEPSAGGKVGERRQTPLHLQPRHRLVDVAEAVAAAENLSADALGVFRLAALRPRRAATPGRC